MRASKFAVLTFASSLALSAFAADMAGAKKPAEEKFRLDTKASVINWTGKKVTGQHHGRVWLKGGEVVFAGDQVAGGSFEADMKTIKVDDLTDPNFNAKLTGHLNSADFFETEKYPTALFKIKQVVAKPGVETTHEITGDLTIKGITHPVTFPAKIVRKDGRAEAKGSMVVDRTLYNIKYGSGKFFQGLGDKVIYDEFTLDLDLAAAK